MLAWWSLPVLVAVDAYLISVGEWWLALLASASWIVTFAVYAFVYASKRLATRRR
jgi:hypothetical protein